MTTSLGTALSALTAHTQAMQVTSHNIANAATPGFSKQRADLGTLTPQRSQIGMIGRGVEVDKVRRVFDNLVIDRLRDSNVDLGRYERLGQLLNDAELVFSEPGPTGLSASLDSLFQSVEDLAANPEQGALRAGFVEQLRTFTDTVTSIGSQLDAQRNDLLEAARFEVREVNDLIARISQLNQEVRSATLSGRPPNDLADRRDILLGELAQKMDISVNRNAVGNAVNVEVNGTLLISPTSGLELAVQRGGQGAEIQYVLADGGDAVDIRSGTLGALGEMSDEILPNVIDRMNELVQVIVREFNQIHATGANPFNRTSQVTSDRVIDTALTATDLDSTDHELDATGLTGVPELMLPDFTDANGSVTTRNLTINVTDVDTGVAEKFIVRYDPGSGATAESRSLDDLISAINSGRGGGFSVEPPQHGGIPGITAGIASVDGGVRLQLSAETGKAIDFSRALDTRPADSAWTGGSITLSGTNSAFADARLMGRIDGTDLELVTFDSSGVETVHGTFDLTSGSPPAVAGFSATFTAIPGASYTDGETFTIDLDDNGAGTGSVSQAYVDGDAGFQVRGRYTGDHSYDPSQPWRMRVVQSGTVGSDTSPPIVEFTWYDGDDQARQQNVTSVVLDGDHQPGSPVPIGEGVFVTFDSGDLTVGGGGVDIVIDGQPDQTGLLAGLGINTLLAGSNMQDLEVDRAIRDDPDRLALGHSRAAGDNANLLDIGDIRTRGLFLDGQQRLDDFYLVTVSDIASRIAQTETLRDNQEAVKLSLENRRDDISGVNVDEEVGNLITQQQAYTAAARVVSISRENIQTLMDLFR